ncbi:MAG: hypothetical protein LBC96_03255 [Lachnospiraceae bacterium]|nr:hypothetical protein [Lachnospiraceae bacterium]
MPSLRGGLTRRSNPQGTVEAKFVCRHCEAVLHAEAIHKDQWKKSSCAVIARRSYTPKQSIVSNSNKTTLLAKEQEEEDEQSAPSKNRNRSRQP